MTFGIECVIITSVGPSNDIARCVAVQPDGKIIVCCNTFSNGSSDYCVIRYNRDGSIDKGFGKNGIVVVSLSDGSDMANAVAL
jgi:hypothetical protein